MHPYSINSNERVNVQLILAGASILIAWLIKTNLDFPWWFEDPSIIGVYGLLYLFFDRYLWQIRLLHIVGLVKTPNINGEWSGQLNSSFDDFKTKFVAELKIIQYWTSIEISFNSLTSKGKSLVAAFDIKSNGEVEMTYTYLNEPVGSALPPMNIHKGTSTLCFSECFSKTDGEYYSGRGRQQYGEVHFKRNR